MNIEKAIAISIVAQMAEARASIPLIVPAECERGITISTSHVEYGDLEPIDRPYLLAIPVMFYRRISE